MPKKVTKEDGKNAAFENDHRNKKVNRKPLNPKSKKNNGKRPTYRPNGNKEMIDNQIKVQVEELITYLFNRLKAKDHDYIDRDSLHRNIIHLDLNEIDEENVEVT